MKKLNMNSDGSYPTDLLDEIEKQIRETDAKNTETIENQKKKKKSYYKPVAGRRKLPQGKKARPSKKGATEFEYELMYYLNFEAECDDVIQHIWRSPSSESPVDVWSIEAEIDKTLGYPTGLSIVRCYQCKTTKDTSPPKINEKEKEKFVEFCYNIGAQAFWVDRWKKNKNVYVRRIRMIDNEGEFYDEALVEDFSWYLPSKKKKNPT